MISHFFALCESILGCANKDLRLFLAKCWRLQKYDQRLLSQLRNLHIGYTNSQASLEVSSYASKVSSTLLKKASNPYLHSLIDILRFNNHIVFEFLTSFLEILIDFISFFSVIELCTHIIRIIMKWLVCTSKINERSS